MKTQETENQFIEVGTTVVRKKRSKQSQMLANKSKNMKDIIRQRAYTIYINRGMNPGNDKEDWYMAEKEVLLSGK